ncbi:MAG: isocitrate lyase/phosphoenolpyruvate mutase family protein [Parvibaculum sp.]|uniref:isocitrate lyase/PEP mutase family protein n=1 Tax=Parvibaculum sp. TaxID=2024848 RepID=UPI0025CC5737|nr:isocitrate lyase/phosphoenolpyruvate mutase family protein [Parvibaculum sp.]MCE9648740.1 isocitrate lyase/phosphoenolpyruvate mutase family protein [Parvibaculum sp.]
MPSQQDKAQTFQTLHASSPGFIMPNAWDAGSAMILAAEGFKAIGTTSAGIAFSLGKQDYNVSDPSLAVTREEMFVRMRDIVVAVPVPVNGDLEAGFGDSPDAVANTIVMAIEADLAGGNIEDKKPLEKALYEEALAVERIAAARAAVGGNAFVLTARTDAMQTDPPDALKTVVRRANLFLEAGADCIFVPGVTDLETIAVLLREIAGPINIVAGLGTSQGNAHDMLAAGIRRVSLGGSIARSALGFIRQCARELRDEGTFGFSNNQIAPADLNALFARRKADRP